MKTNQGQNPANPQVDGFAKIVCTQMTGLGVDCECNTDQTSIKDEILPLRTLDSI